MELTSGEHTLQKRCACQHFVSERVGVLAEHGEVAVRLLLGLHSLTTPLPFPAQFACALFVLDIAWVVSRALVSLSLSVTGKKRREG